MQPSPNFPKGPSPFPPGATGQFPVRSPVEYPGASYFPDVDETVLPVTPPTAGGFVYAKGGQLFFRNASGETNISTPTPPPLGAWSGVNNFVDTGGDGVPAVMPNAVPAGECLFCLVTNNLTDDVDPLTVSDTVNGAWTRLGYHLTGANNRAAWLYCFLGSAAAAPGTLSVSAAQLGNTWDLMAWSQSPPVGAVTLVIGLPNAAGGVSAAPASGGLTAVLPALIVAGMRQVGASGGMTPGAGFTSVGAGAGSMQAEFTPNAAPGAYDGTFTLAGALEWVALAAIVYAMR